MIVKTTLFIPLLTTGLLLLNACGSPVQDKGKNPLPTLGSPEKGIFLISVEGMQYTRTFTSIPQTTDKASSYTHRTGEIITFHIGNLEIGEVPGLSVVTPKDIVAYKNLDLNTSINSSEVNNRVRLLMSLDSDKVYTNGIQISQDSRDKAKTWSTPNYALNEADFVSEVASATGGELVIDVNKTQAQTHFEEALRCVYSGAYSGSWILPSGDREGFVGVMIQKDGFIVALGDGQDINKTGTVPDVIYSSGTHDMDNGVYSFNDTWYFDKTTGGVIGAPITDINGSGSSQGYNRVSGIFVQNGQNGAYSATRVGSGVDTAYRYTGYGRGNNGGSTNINYDVNGTNTDPILGLFTFDISIKGNVTGLIHDARTDKEPSLSGRVDFVNNTIFMNLNSGNGHTLSGDINISNSGDLLIDWYDENNATLGYMEGIGCQLQPHN